MEVERKYGKRKRDEEVVMRALKRE